MTLIIEPIHIWWLLGLAITFLGAVAGLGRWFLAQMQRREDDRFAVLMTESKGWRTVERDLMALRAELPERYVRREDHIRGQAVVEAKLDAVSARLEVLQIQGATRAN